jgi:hypothetical protein
MASANRPPLPSSDSYNAGNPFAKRAHVAFQEPNPFASSTTLSQDFIQRGEESDEKQPLTQFSGGFYPPGYATVGARFLTVI